jgi:adenylosuccinate synthase
VQKMPAIIVVGLQWGDEGKGKTTDALAGNVTMVIRYQGGDNAGHTIMLGDEVFKLHLVPSGVLYPHIMPIIGNGVVVNPKTLIAELAMLTERGISTSKIRVSRKAHVIMPYHIALDGAMEDRLAKSAVGTTKRGIGPAYADRAWRIGLRMEDLLNPVTLHAKLERILPDKNRTLRTQYKAEGFELEALWREAVVWGEKLRPYITDTTRLIQEALARHENILFEGAQGALLDLDHGSYPFVTSSNPIAGGACTGGGIGPLQVKRVIGVMKAYATRVGSGPFPTELTESIGDYLTEKGHEFGTTTGRRRRVGWFDAVPLRYAVALNSCNAIMMNKIDIFSGLKEIKVCVAYEIDGERVDWWPADADDLSRAKPIYKTYPGWAEDISGARTMADLPVNARKYIKAVEAMCGAPIDLISVGPERSQTIVRRKWA